MTVQRLTAAFRSRPRPSSALDAKASTMCPSYLDGEPATTLHKDGSGAITHRERSLLRSLAVTGNVGTLPVVGLCAVFKRRRGRPAGVSRPAVPEN